MVARKLHNSPSPISQSAAAGLKENKKKIKKKLRKRERKRERERERERERLSF